MEVGLLYILRWLIPLVQLSKKIMKRYPIFSVQIINYQIDQKYKQNILDKFYFKSFRNGYFVFSPYGILLILTRLKLK